VGYMWVKAHGENSASQISSDYRNPGHRQRFCFLTEVLYGWEFWSFTI